MGDLFRFVPVPGHEPEGAEQPVSLGEEELVETDRSGIGFGLGGYRSWMLHTLQERMSHAETFT